MELKITYAEKQFDDVTPSEALQVIENGIGYEMKASPRGNNRLMYVGWTRTACLLEIGVEFVSETEIHVFHGMATTRPHRNLFGAQ